MKHRSYPGISSAAACIERQRSLPLAIVAPPGTAYSIPGNWKSDAYFADPVTLQRAVYARGVACDRATIGRGLL